jgi:hypothetical protein
MTASRNEGLERAAFESLVSWLLPGLPQDELAHLTSELARDAFTIYRQCELVPPPWLREIADGCR